MNNIGFIFPGQGSQKLGMLADLAAKFSVVEEAFAQASTVLDKDLWQVSQTDQNEQLNQTDITQPVLLAASVALWRTWQDQQGSQPSILAGHSLGEYSA